MGNGANTPEGYKENAVKKTRQFMQKIIILESNGQAAIVDIHIKPAQASPPKSLRMPYLLLSWTTKSPKILHPEPTLIL